ncbi:hypothetical protein DPMN_102610 [Dreissena polymorpha]|uniref:CARD domain-containing protein n=1 Tax=Dreissena polymorpha TaxID=45954 RepID=A0A9D4RAP2_DREPO|nr:hypothetical protein DPMN_102610 [Dreissena polymorpha]
MSQTIKAPSTNDDKIDVFLTTLKRRGPNAFDAFIEALHPHHDFLAEILMDEYKALKSKADRRQSIGSDGLRSNRNSTTSLGSYERLNENSQQMCSHCKQTLGKDAADFFAENEETIFIQPNNLTSMSSETLIIGKWLDGLYRKLKYHIFTTNTRELSFKSPKPVTIAMVEKLIDELISMEQMCYKELAAQKSNESLLNLIKDLKISNNKLNEKVISAEQRTDRYAAQIVDLETKCRNKTAENQSMQTETEGLRSQIISLNERLMKVEEEIKRKHAELEKAQKTVETLKATLDHPTEELQREIRRLNREIFLKEFKLMKMSKSPKKQQQAKKLEAQYEIATTKEYQQVAVGYKQQKQQLPKSSQQHDLQNDLNRKSKVNLELQLPSIEENTQISLTMPKEQLSKSEGSRTTSTHFPTLREGDHFSEHQTDGIDNNVNHTTSLLTPKEKYEENRTILKFPTDNIPTPRERRSPSVMLTLSHKFASN